MKKSKTPCKPGKTPTGKNGRCVKTLKQRKPCKPGKTPTGKNGRCVKAKTLKQQRKNPKLQSKNNRVTDAGVVALASNSYKSPPKANECCVCYTKNNLIPLHCNRKHVLCTDCIIRLPKPKLCPLCRTKLNIDDVNKVSLFDYVDKHYGSKDSDRIEEVKEYIRYYVYDPEYESEFTGKTFEGREDKEYFQGCDKIDSYFKYGFFE
jgi:hypothetical protein